MGRQPDSSVRERERRAERRRIEVVEQQRFRRDSGRHMPAAARLTEVGHVLSERRGRATSMRETEKDAACGRVREQRGGRV